MILCTGWAVVGWMDWLLRSLWSAGGLARAGWSGMSSLPCQIAGTISVGAMEMTWPYTFCHNGLVLVCLHSSGHGIPKNSKREGKPSTHVLWNLCLHHACSCPTGQSKSHGEAQSHCGSRLPRAQLQFPTLNLFFRLTLTGGIWWGGNRFRGSFSFSLADPLNLCVGQKPPWLFYVRCCFPKAIPKGIGTAVLCMVDPQGDL